ncbi:hypothetical protein [Desulfosediminicola sp.]|uniref:hypothetical protein n=1 Tax=Desulfosediminicola sp. TaxID=2886825 RepID=UPI003AF1FE49
MIKTIITFILGVLLCSLSCIAQGKEVTREQIKGLDEQVQEIKSDVLSIATELNKLEEVLLYPSNTEISMFINLKEGEQFRLDSVEISLDGQPVAHYIYTFKELEALRMGGVQRIYTGNVTSGTHTVQVNIKGKSKGGSTLDRAESFKVQKDVGPAVVAITLAQQSITFSDR